MEKILGSCSLRSLYHYYSILLLLLIIIPLILVLITATPPDPLPLFSTLNPNNNYSKKSLLFSLSFSLFISVSAQPCPPTLSVPSVISSFLISSLCSCQFFISLGGKLGFLIVFLFRQSFHSGFFLP